VGHLMLPIILVFLFLLIFVFAVVSVGMRPGKRQKAVHNRFAEVLGMPSEPDADHYGADGRLIVAQDESLGSLKMILAGTSIGRYLQRMILQSQVQSSASTILIITLSAAAGVFVAIWLTTSLLIVATASALGAGYTPLAYLRFRRSKRLAAFDAALPECVETCARSIRAGHSLVAALAIVAEHAPEPAGVEFQEVIKKQNYGLPLSEAFRQMMDRVPSKDLQVMVTAFLVQRDTGGNLVEVLDRLVFVIRERMRIQRDIRTHTAQGRLTGWILCLLPVGLLAVINFINPGYSKTLLNDATGRKMLYAGGGLLVIGGFIIRNIVNGIEV
jgi:tight adherence protein B